MLLKKDKRPAHARLWGGSTMGYSYQNNINAPLMHEVPDKDTIKHEVTSLLSVPKRGYVSKNDLLEGIPKMLFKLQTAYRRQINSAFPRYCFRWPRAACPATARTGGGKRSWFSCRCPCACVQHNRFCLVFSNKFNTITALSINQSPTLPQKIDSREGLF